jgi:hypothetical protein
VYTENLLPGAAAPGQDPAPAARPLEPPGAAVQVLKRVIAQMEGEHGWVELGAVGRQLANVAPDFDPRTYGFGKLSDLVRKTGAFEVEQPKDRNMRVRVKPALPAERRRSRASS